MTRGRKIHCPGFRVTEVNYENINNTHQVKVNMDKRSHIFHFPITLLYPASILSTPSSFSNSTLVFPELPIPINASRLTSPPLTLQIDPSSTNMDHLTGPWPTLSIFEIRTIFPGATPTFLANLSSHRPPNQKLTCTITSSLIDSPYAFEGLLFYHPNAENENEGLSHSHRLQGFENPIYGEEGGERVFEAEFEVVEWRVGVVGKGRVRIRVEGEDLDPAFFVEGRRTFFGEGECFFEGF